MFCARCGGLFGRRYANQKYCSDRCRADARFKDATPFARPFRAFDGEGEDDRYTLLASSDGRRIHDRAGLSTRECLRFLLDAGPGCNNVWFGFGYDVNMILRDVPLDGTRASLEHLHEEKHTWWEDYHIRYIPRKQFMVTKGERGKRGYKSFNSYDTIGFFQSSFEKACEEWLGGVPDIIREGKAAREVFSRWHMSRIIAYNDAECKALVEIMDMLRAALQEAGLRVTRWDGAGAIAAAWLGRIDARRFYGELPAGMSEPLACSFFGGNINVSGIGHVDCKQYDIASAYPHSATLCPDMSNLSWTHRTTNKLPRRPYGLARVRWALPSNVLWPALPYRVRSGAILYPEEGEGWYFGIEAALARERFGKRVQILETWDADGDEFFPLAPHIQRDYAQRAAWKAQRNPAERVVKLGMNSIYGKFAQRFAFSKDGIPAWRNFLWAGYITAQTRAQIQAALLGMDEHDMYAVMTDGILCAQPIACAKQLGGWSDDEDVIAADILGAGLYQTYDSAGDAVKHKARGFSAEPLSYGETLARWWRGDPTDEVVKVRRFVGMGMALASDKYREHFRTFIDLDKTLSNPLSVGTGKRLPADLGATRTRFAYLAPRPRFDDAPSHPYKVALFHDPHTDECID